MLKRKGFGKKKYGEDELSKENEGVNDEISSWNIFQKCLLRDDESSKNKSMIDNNDFVHAVAEDDSQLWKLNFVGMNNIPIVFVILDTYLCLKSKQV